MQEGAVVVRERLSGVSWHISEAVYNATLDAVCNTNRHLSLSSTSRELHSVSRGCVRGECIIVKRECDPSFCRTSAASAHGSRVILVDMIRLPFFSSRITRRISCTYESHFRSPLQVQLAGERKVEKNIIALAPES